MLVEPLDVPAPEDGWPISFEQTDALGKHFANGKASGESATPPPYVEAVVDEPQQTAKIVQIEPLEPVVRPAVVDLNRTLDWLDLWADDANCTNYTVSLMPPKSVSPQALVSFPGSGNSWVMK